MKKIINIAVIAHVDAGKSTLVDALLAYSGGKDLEVNRIMDSDDIEKERGITIYSKNCSIDYKGCKINVVDTPGHADFSSEVERIIKTVDTVILLVDSAEGPMPQTRFVLRKSLENGLKPILLINKIDKPDRRPEEVIESVYELFMDLDATDDQIDFPILYGITRDHIIQYDIDDGNDTVEPLLETIIKNVDAYPNKDEEPLQMQISSLAYDDYIGRIGIGRLYRGTLSRNQKIVLVDPEGDQASKTVRRIYTYEGLERTEVETAHSGDIVLVSGIEDISIGDTLCDPDHVEAMPAIPIEEPTMSMYFGVNNSPFAGQDGRYLTSRNIRERLLRELEVNVGLRVEETASADQFKVSGRGELHLTVLIENMRREGYELSISKPEVIFKKDDSGKTTEPVEEVYIETPSDYSGSIIQALTLRQGDMRDMREENGMTYQWWHVPTRGLIGFRSRFINLTHGEGTLIRRFLAYEPMRGEVPQRQNGSMVSTETGTAMTYSIFHLQERGEFFIGAQADVYEGMIVGISSRDMDMEVNPTKNKKATAVRSSGRDEAMKLVTPIPITLESAIEFIRDDELVEVTPKHIRLRKKLLKANDRKKQRRSEKWNESN